MFKHGKCIHFTGIHNDACKAGVKYRAVRVDEPRRGWPCLTLAGQVQVGRCDLYRDPTPEEIAADKARLDRVLDCMRRRVSTCCEAPYDTSQVIQSGRHKGHGPRFCSKCGKVAVLV